MWVAGWPTPLTQGATSRSDQLWSISKVATALAVALESPGAISGPVYRAMSDAITRSDNCAQWRLALALEQLTGSNASAAAAFRRTFTRAAVSPRGTYEVSGGDDPTCVPYLIATRGTSPDPFESVVEFGAYTWNVLDAIRFAYTLGTGGYGKSGALVLRLMREPKHYALEPTSRQDYTSPLDRPPSGGDFPSAWRPAYKGGWGGSADDDLLAEQIVVLDVNGHIIALAAMFWPSAPTPNDDPGQGVSPKALEALFSSVRERLEQLAAGKRSR
jgi:hypothetical protein